MKVTFEDFCERVKEDTEKTTPKVDQYRAAVKYFYEMHEAGYTVAFNETFTSFQNGVLNFLNEKVENQASFSARDLKKLLAGRLSDFRYGYNYAKKALQVY